MDERRFDALAVALATATSRRRVLAALLGGLVAGLGRSWRGSAATPTPTPRLATAPTPNFPFLVALPSDAGFDRYGLDFQLTGPPARFRALEAMTFVPPAQRAILETGFREAYAATVAAAQNGAPNRAQRGATTTLVDLGTPENAARAQSAMVAALLAGPRTKRLAGSTPAGATIGFIGCDGQCEGALGALPGSSAPYLGLAAIGRRDRFLFDLRIRDFGRTPVTAADGAVAAGLIDAKLVAIATPTRTGEGGGTRLARSLRSSIDVMAAGPSGLQPSPQATNADSTRALERANTFPLFAIARDDPPPAASQWLSVAGGTLVPFFGESAVATAARRRQLAGAWSVEHSQQALPLSSPYRGDYDLSLAATQSVFPTAAAARAFLAAARERVTGERPGIRLTEVASSATERSYVFAQATQRGPLSGYQIHALVSAAPVDAVVRVDVFAAPRRSTGSPVPDDALRQDLGPIASEAMKALVACLKTPATCPPTATLPAPVAACPAGAETCGGRCVDLATNADNCGGCGVSCRGSACCGGSCVDLTADPANCGACGTVCRTGATCQKGACAATGCPAGSRSCGGVCVETDSDPTNCGDCDRRCAADRQCAQGACVCPGGLTDCGTCVDLSTDAANCGGCGGACASGQVCAGGACVCPSGATPCGDACCTSGQTCQGGACVECPGGQLLCNGGCIDPATDPANCGACGATCESGRLCAAGKCVCPSGLTACGDACVDTGADPANCGGCGITCAPGQTCAGGACACPSGLMLCSGSCVDVSSDPANCGACDTVCAPGSGCSGGYCVAPA